MDAVSTAKRIAVLCVISLVTPAVLAEVIELDGTVKAVDATARIITVERKTPRGKKALELEVTKKAGDLDTIKPGDAISFSYDPDLEIVTKFSRGKNSEAAAPRSMEGTICRIGFNVATDGSCSGFIEEGHEPANDEASKGSERRKADEGLWTITHRFPDKTSCEPYRGSFTGKAAAALFSAKHKAIELKPSADINGGWANLHAPYRLRLPATVVVDVEAIGRRAYVTLPLKTTLTNSEINVLSDDGFRTCDVSHLYVTRRRNQPPKITKAFRKDGVPLASGCQYEVGPHLSMSLQEICSTGVSSFLGPDKSCSGIRVKQITITARFVPVLGVALKQEGDVVVVAVVLPGSPAQASGVRPGDHIVTVLGKPVSQWQRAMQLLAVTELDEDWEIEIDRQGRKKSFKIKATVP